MSATRSRAYGGVSLEGRRRDQRERIIAAACNVFARRGWADTSIDDIVRSARVSRTSFYELFESKERCLLAVFNAGMERMARALAETVALELEPLERIRAEVRTVAATFADDPAMARVILIEVVGATRDAERARVQARLAMASLIERQLAGYPMWERRSEEERRVVSLSAMAAIVEPLSMLVATDRLDQWESVIEPVTQYLARGLIRDG